MNDTRVPGRENWRPPLMRHSTPSPPRSKSRVGMACANSGCGSCLCHFLLLWVSLEFKGHHGLCTTIFPCLARAAHFPAPAGWTYWMGTSKDGHSTAGQVASQPGARAGCWARDGQPAELHGVYLTSCTQYFRASTASFAVDVYVLGCPPRPTGIERLLRCAVNHAPAHAAQGSNNSPAQILH
jgi:hypothetical protein